MTRHAEWCRCDRHFIPQTPMARMWDDRLREERERAAMTATIRGLAERIDRDIFTMFCRTPRA